MRLGTAIVAAICAFAAPASAADFGSGGFATFGQRAGQIVIYDDQPGVVVRAYWAPPWRNRHYFPVTGTVPDSGRHEDLAAPRRHYPPAQSFYREWWTSSVFELPAIDFAQPVPLAAAPGPDEAVPSGPEPRLPERRFDHLRPEAR